MKWRLVVPFLRAFWHRPADYLPCGTPRSAVSLFPLPWMIPDRSSPSRVPLRGFHQSAVAIGNQRVHGDAPVLVLVEQRDGSAKQPLHLISEPGLRSPAAVVHAERPHELRERFSQGKHRGFGSARGFGRDPGQQEARQVAVGGLIIRARHL